MQSTRVREECCLTFASSGVRWKVDLLVSKAIEKRLGRSQVIIITGLAALLVCKARD
jgi:hypothetical protein